MAFDLTPRPSIHRPASTVTAYRAALRHVLATIRRDGATAALADLRRERPVFTDLGYHDTAAVYLVWAVDRLVAAGLDDIRVIWHPLVQMRSMRQWWDDATLCSTAAIDGFVAPTRYSAGDPVPTEPRSLIAA